jgi:hypothetical protein
LLGLGLVGCSKKVEPPNENVQINGVSVDMPKLQKIFSTETNPEIQKVTFDLDQGFRYRDYAKALAAAEELSSKTELNDDEKKVTADVVEQLKKVTGAGGAPAQ